ncbi:peptide chain release factor N(5)-glutamine methyltransferase [Thermonema rossianum]|uniref:peptide chain release factor N(5)-glutamine methyltransferase n=1 Tax=Thermonema rossianum TaxID=55505 RepID=UPI000A030045|nr:peptide chain release factor N(5)-glutamine methyltransferase [Thermonema rossianum]
MKRKLQRMSAFMKRMMFEKYKGYLQSYKIDTFAGKMPVKPYKEWEALLLDRLRAVYALPEAQVVARWLLEKRAGAANHQRLLNAPLALSEEVLRQLRQDVERLLQHEPVQYVLGEAYFYGMRFEVSPAVLIPRRETEELVEWVLQSVASQQSLRLLDIGTGSGCIAIALKKHLPAAEVHAWDVSPEALAQAARNAVLHHVEIRFSHKDILVEAAASAHEDQWGVIVSNPPYIPQKEKADMQRNVTDYEPATALFVDDNRPLLFYEAIAQYALQTLAPGGLLFLEIHEDYGEACKHMLELHGFAEVVLRHDMQGKNRMIRAYKP